MTSALFWGFLEVAALVAGAWCIVWALSRLGVLKAIKKMVE
jgi:hypothetical protein